VHRFEDDPQLAEPGAGSLPPRRFAELVAHLARREVASAQQGTVLGAAWPVVRQLGQLGVLVFVFGSVLDLGIENFAVFVFTGLIAWNWFSTAVTGGTSSLISSRHLVLQPRLPSVVLPVVPVAVAFLDVLFALPILLLMLAATGELTWQIVLWPGIIVVQLLLTMGLAWLLAGVSVFLRDVPGLVAVVLTLLFYVTPVFYGLRTVPDRFEWILQLNPMTTIVGAYRAVMVGEAGPSAALMAAVAGFSVLIAVAGLLAFRRLEPRFADVL
jgi:lipopolysaccharide transport system permease protein